MRLAPDAGFIEMRAGLINRGLLTPDLRLTDAGQDHVLSLIDELRAAPAPEDSGRAAVRWNCGYHNAGSRAA